MRFGAFAPKIGMGMSGVFSSAKFSVRPLGVDESEAINANPGSSRVEKLELELVPTDDEGDDSRSFSSSAILLIVLGDHC